MADSSVLQQLFPVSTVEQIRACVRTFSRDAGTHEDRATSIMSYTKYWLFDPDTNLFGPAKFVGFADMTFDFYDACMNEASNFDGSRSRKAIERALGESFHGEDVLRDLLPPWADSVLEEGILDRVTQDRWEFVRLPGREDCPGPDEDDPFGLDDLPKDALRERAMADSTMGPERKRRVVSVPERSAAIRRYALRRADGICEGCDRPAPFVTRQRKPYLEVHHIQSLADAGPDHPQWVAALCPNCHRRAHHGADAEAFNGRLADIARSKEPDA